MARAQEQQAPGTVADELPHPDRSDAKPDLLSTLGGIAVLLILITVVVDVAFRVFAGSGILVADTIVSDWWMVAVAMFGIVAAERSRAQIVVDIAAERVSEKAARRIAMFASSVVAVFALIIAVITFFEAVTQMRAGEYAAVGQTPIWPARFLIPLGFGGLAVFSATNAMRAFRRVEGAAS